MLTHLAVRLEEWEPVDVCSAVMSPEPGTYELDPDHGELTVRTGRTGAAARAGHDLVIAVERWGATVQLAPDPAQSVLELTADSTSLTVREGTGGIKPLGEKDKDAIAQTINQEVLKGTPISFRSTAVRPDGDGRFRVTGDLELANGISLVAFDLTITDGGRISATATITQSDWGLKPYSGMFGTLKVADEVQVVLDAQLQPVS